MFSGQWIFRNKLHVYPDQGYRPWPHHDITGKGQCLLIGAQHHDVTSLVPVAKIVGSRWMTEDFMLLLKLPS